MTKFNPQTIIEVLYLGNMAAGFAASLYEQFTDGAMTEEEAIAKWNANAVRVIEEGKRFDRLTSP